MLEEFLAAAKFLIVDDEWVNVSLLEQLLERNGFANTRGITDSLQAVAAFGEFRPDIVLLDLMMPGIDGFEVMARLDAFIPQDSFVPILILTADSNPATKQRALSCGASDFLTKPFDSNEVTLRIKNLLRTRWQHLLLHEQNHVLELRVAERTQELEQSQMEILERLAQASEFRDDDTGQHTQRVGEVSALLARELGFTHSEVELLRRAAPLHDAGKIGIADSILLKPGKLTAEEYRIMQTHAKIGANLLSRGRSPLVQMAETIAISHHEKWDGSGYPCGLRGEEIPLLGRIVAVADVYDALTHHRPYKKAWELDAAIAEIQSQSGRHIDPAVIECFLRLLAAGALPPISNQVAPQVADQCLV